MDSRKRQHPLAVVHAFTNYIILLALPLLRSLTMIQKGFWGWLSGVWQDGLVLLAILIFGYFRWMMNTYELRSEGILCKDGIFVRRSRYINYNCISTVSIEHPWYLRPFKIARLRLETDSGSRQEPDVKLILKRSEAELILRTAGRTLKQGEFTSSYIPYSLSVAFVSLLTSSSLTGVLFASTLISQTGRILGEKAETMLISSLTRLMQLVAFGLPPVAAVIGMTILGGWLLDFIINLIHHLGFSAVRDGERLHLRAGILTIHEYQLAVDKIHFLQLRQSLFTRLLGYCSVLINCTGYGKEKNAIAVLLPAADEKEVERGLGMILPEVRPARGGCHATRRSITRFLTPPLTTLGIFLLTIWLSWHIWPELRTLIFFLGLMAVLPAVWWLFVKIEAHRHVGMSISGNTCTFRTVWGYTICTTIAPRNKVALAELSQSLFQRMQGCCNVIIRLRSEQGKRLVIQNVSRCDAERFLEQLAEKDTKMPE